MDNQMKSELFRFNSSLLTSCPISTNIEDWHKYLPKRCTRKFYIHLKNELICLDTWHKDMAVKLKEIYWKNNYEKLSD